MQGYSEGEKMSLIKTNERKLKDEIKQYNLQELVKLSGEIREQLIDVVSENGGHLASNLGVVELTLALHYVFNSSKDKFIWDVGHQAYVHKILTGRKECLNSIRKHGGISGFPKCNESEDDCFDVGHSSTSVSAALGLANARDLQGENYSVLAVIGDGAMTGGMAFEALNHAGHLQTDMTVILNDNEMSISGNVGAMSSYLNKVRLDPNYTKRKQYVENLLTRIPKIGTKVAWTAEKIKDTVKYLMVPGQLFEELGFRYFGPVDGHNLEELIDVLKKIKGIKGPKIVHVITKKGKGYKFAEENPDKFHGIGSFDKETGEVKNKSEKISYTKAFSNALLDIAEIDDKVLAITAAMDTGTGTDVFSRKYPHRFYDVGIAEQHAVTFAAALARGGMKPVVAIYSTFLQRAYDQIVHDVALQKLPVIFAMDRAGLVGEDGPTHHGVFDISYLRHIPEMILMAPRDEKELGDMLYSATKYNSPAAIRYPRGEGTGVIIDRGRFEIIEKGKGELLCSGHDVLIIGVGSMVEEALKAKEILENSNISAAVINARFIKPLDENLIIEEAKDKKLIITVEENALKGGFSEEIASLLEDKGLVKSLLRIGIEDKFIEHGPQKLLREECGLSGEKIAERIKDRFLSSGSFARVINMNRRKYL